MLRVGDLLKSGELDGREPLEKACPFGISASRNRQSHLNFPKFSGSGYVQTAALGKNCDGVRTGNWRKLWKAFYWIFERLGFEGIGAICAANRRKGQRPFNKSSSKGLVKLPFRQRLWEKTAMACVLKVHTHCSFFPKRCINGSFTSPT